MTYLFFVKITEKSVYVFYFMALNNHGPDYEEKGEETVPEKKT